MFVELRLRLPAVQRWRNTHQFENGFCQHAGWIFANPVNHHGKTEFVQENRQQRRQVGLFTRAVVTGDDNRHRLACRRRQLDGVILHGFVKAEHLCFPFPFDTQRNQYAAQLKVRDFTIEHMGIQAARSIPV